MTKQLTYKQIYKKYKDSEFFLNGFQTSYDSTIMVTRRKTVFCTPRFLYFYKFENLHGQQREFSKRIVKK